MQPLSRLPSLLWTLWVFLDPALAPWRMEAPWALSQGLSLWLFGLLAIALGGAILRQYGPAALALSVLAVFLALLLLSEVVFVQSVVLPNPPVLADLWRNPSTEAYALFLSWVQGWCIGFALILGAGRLAAKYRPQKPN